MNHNPPLIPRVSPYAVWYYATLLAKSRISSRPIGLPTFMRSGCHDIDELAAPQVPAICTSC